MATVYWLFSSNRTPALDCDGYDRFPDSDYIVVMKRGHVYNVPMNCSGHAVTYGKLASIFEEISQHTPEGINWASILTTANRDDWARVSPHLRFTSLSVVDLSGAHELTLSLRSETK